MARDGATASKPLGEMHRTNWTWLDAAMSLLSATAVGIIAWSEPGILTASLTLPVWLIAGMVVAAEVTVVHLEHTRGLSFSLREIPIALGLVFAAPPDLLVGSIIGGLVAATLHRKERTFELVHGLGRNGLQVGVAVMTFHAIVGNAGPNSTRGWLAILVATLLASTLPTMLTGFTPPGRRATARQRLHLLRLTGTAAALNTSLAIVMITVLWSSPELWWVAMIPPAVLVTAYRTSISHRVERQRLERLYEASRLLHASPQVEDALVVATEQAQAMFGVSDVEIVVLAESGGHCFHTVRSAGGMDRILLPMERNRASTTLTTALQQARTRSIRDIPGLLDDSPAVHSGMLAPLYDNERLAGVVLVANRVNAAVPFSTADSRLLQAFAQHLGVSIENGRLEDSLKELTHLKERLRHQASHDALTGLANRVMFTESVESALAGARLAGRVVAVLFLDLDDFKNVNDGLGHAAGDQLLRQASHRLTESVRPGDLVARFGGDEFAVLLTHVEDPAAVLAVANRISQSLGVPFELGDETVSVSASVGVAIGSGTDSPDALIRHADTAMYAAKRQAKGTVRVYEARMHEAISTRLSMRSELTIAIEERKLAVAYQPIIDLETGLIRGLEALLRWPHPERGLIEPGSFIPFAEESGLIVPLGEWVIEQAVEQAARWQSEYPHLHLGVAANLSPRQLTEGNVAAFLADVVAHHGADPRRLTVEITENTIMQAPIASVEEIRDLGVSLAIDDFGTGYSSLAYLDRLPIDILKIDRSFVERIRNGTESPLVRTILQLGTTLGLTTIVEGVETREQLDRLRQLRAGAAQGFYLAPPLARASIDALLANTRGQVLRPLPTNVRHLRQVDSQAG